MRRLGLAVTLAAVLGLVAAAAAQQLPASGPAAAGAPTLAAPTGAAAAPSAAAAAPATQPLTLQAGTGMLLRLPQAAAAVMSADPQVARVQPASPTSLFLMGASPGHTTVVATADSGALIVQYDVNVTPGANGPKPVALPFGGPPPAAPAGPERVTAATANAIRAAIAQSVPGGAHVNVAPTGDAVLLSGMIATAAESLQAEAIARAFLAAGHGQVIDNMQVLGSLQVNVRVRIAEIDRQITRQLGFNWQALGSGTPWKFGLFTANAANAMISAGSQLGTQALNSLTADQLGGAFTNSNWDINGIIDALAADQLITILAEPNLTALSGETASFLAGGEFPVPIAGAVANGAVQVTVQFQQYGVSLSVVPTVLAPNRLNLRIRPEVSELSTAGAVSMPVGTGSVTIPALTVRRAETTIELGSGQSFAIAGLLQHTSTNIINAFPYLGEMPVLGALFRSTQFQRGDSELVIIVTPYIVRPAASPAVLRAPTDHFTPATDLDRVLFGRQLAGTPAAEPTAALPAGAGFILK